jgi:hypothetical protein
MRNTENGTATRNCGRLFGRCTDCREWEPIPFHDKGGVCLASTTAPANWLSRLGLPGMGAPAARAAVAPVRVVVD